MPYYNRDPKRDHSFDNHPYTFCAALSIGCSALLLVAPGSALGRLVTGLLLRTLMGIYLCLNEWINEYIHMFIINNKASPI